MDEELKQKLLPAFAVFNLTVGIYMLVKYFLVDMSRPTSTTWGEFILHALIGAGIGLVTGGITYVVSAKK